MTAMPNDEFADEVLKLAGKAEDFQPQAVYDPDGDCIEFLVKADPFYAKRLDDLVTVYHSQETDELVGCLIKSVTSFCRKHPQLRIVVQDGRLKLESLFLTRLPASEAGESDPVMVTYQKLAEVAHETNAEAELQTC